ncbi:MAG: hypothetical protein AB1529_01155 [Candidatus Micrarchaeota archaeon]
MGRGRGRRVAPGVSMRPVRLDEEEEWEEDDFEDEDWSEEE